MPNTTSIWFSHELCFGRNTKRMRWLGSDRNWRRLAWFFSTPCRPFFSQFPAGFAKVSDPFHQAGRPMHVEVVQNEDPVHIGVAGDGLLNVSHEVRLGASRPDRFGEHRPLYNIPIADQGRVPWRTYSNSRLATSPGIIALSGADRSKACSPVISSTLMVRVPS